jgi:hypothetical protein
MVSLHRAATLRTAYHARSRRADLNHGAAAFVFLESALWRDAVTHKRLSRTQRKGDDRHDVACALNSYIVTLAP